MSSLRYGRITPRRIAGAVKRRIQRRRAAPVGLTPDWAAAEFPPLPDSPVVLGIGPANFAGQGWAWKTAVERFVDGAVAEVFAVQRATFNFPSDRPIQAVWYRDRSWQDHQRERVMNGYTHVLAEAVRPVFGLKYGDTLGADLPVLREAGKPVAILLHGSEIRRPDLHAQRHPHSPFADPSDDLVQVLQAQAVRLGRIVAEFLADEYGPVFVSTPDLLDDVPAATWLPVVVDVDGWRSELVPMVRERPVVVHVPSRAKMKGSDLIDAHVQGLADQGLIEYRRLSDVDPADMPMIVADADIVLDQFALGSYGVSAVQAMAAGRVTVGHVADHVRARIPAPLPIVEATPLTIVSVLTHLVEYRDAARATAAEGLSFVQQFHDGRRSAAVLAPFLGRPLRE